MWRCSVRVTDSKGKRCKGVKVTINASGLLSGTAESNTDSYGWARLSVPWLGPGQWSVSSIYINNEKVSGSAKIKDGQKLMFTL